MKFTNITIWVCLFFLTLSVLHTIFSDHLKEEAEIKSYVTICRGSFKGIFNLNWRNLLNLIKKNSFCQKRFRIFSSILGPATYIIRLIKNIFFFGNLSVEANNYLNFYLKKYCTVRTAKSWYSDMNNENSIWIGMLVTI